MKAPERVLVALDHEEPDFVPAFESTFTNDSIVRRTGHKPTHFGDLVRALRFLPFRHSLMRRALCDPRLVARGLLPLAKFYRAVGLDLLPTVMALFPREIRKGGFVDEFGRVMRFEYYQDGTEVIGYVGGIFSSFEDYEAWEQPDPDWDARLAGVRAGFEVQGELDDEVFVMPATTGVMEVTWEGFGIERFSRLLARPKQARRVFDDRGKFAVETVKAAADEGARLVLVFDDYGYKKGLFMSPANYRRYVFPWLKKVCDAAHKRDCKVMLHSDGDLSEVVDEIVRDCGVDALNPIEPTTANPNWDVFKLGERLGNEVTLAGNVSPVALATGTAEEVAEYTEELIRRLAPGGGYVLASGHSINPAVKWELWKAMMDARERMGRYPIR
ncbi:MAG: hypothetical protein Kow0069_30500 [Promethearchaeota archaeon]